MADNQRGGVSVQRTTQSGRGGTYTAGHMMKVQERLEIDLKCYIIYLE